jgi:hypothetical protein
MIYHLKKLHNISTGVSNEEKITPDHCYITAPKDTTHIQNVDVRFAVLLHDNNSCAGVNHLHINKNNYRLNKNVSFYPDVYEEHAILLYRSYWF